MIGIYIYRKTRIAVSSRVTSPPLPIQFLVSLLDPSND